MRIAIDIDSTLHHYWDRLSAAAQRRFGIDLPYEEQFDWGITRLRPEQLHLCIQETHCDQAILAGEPYPNAVATVQDWHAHGHFIQITSHRDAHTRGATERWLEDIGVPFDELHVSHDKVGHCVEAGIDLLIDDSPENLARAMEHDILVATIAHPWNRDLCEVEGILCAPDWEALGTVLEPVLSGRTEAV
ncbi:MAG: uncharacterized protein QOG15_824 [Solirubrobacteraceae bacterium]|jgi:uncharacterized HAD superfamily protein|nr:uncharacterized protein [Solirubrobacteraceae bacterium]